MKLQSMGMAVMLDEIINYVQSLQNQVEVSQIYITSTFFFVSNKIIFLNTNIYISLDLSAVPFYEAYSSELILRLQLRGRCFRNNAGASSKIV